MLANICDLAMTQGGFSTSQALRLHDNPQRNSSGDFAEGSFCLVQRFKAPLCNQSRQAVQPLFVPHRGTRGSGGKALSFALTFTCHFCLRQTPHWGGVASECPGGLRAWGDAPSTRESGLATTNDALYIQRGHPRQVSSRFVYSILPHLGGTMGQPCTRLAARVSA